MRYEHSHRGLEYLFASMMITWGIWLLLPMPTFDNPIYRPLAVLAPEYVWGAWSAGIGTVRIAALVVNGQWRRTPLVRVGCSILGIMWWSTQIYLYVISGDHNLPAGVAWYPCFIFYEVISCRRSAADAFRSRALSRSFKRQPVDARPG